MLLSLLSLRWVLILSLGFSSFALLASAVLFAWLVGVGGDWLDGSDIQRSSGLFEGTCVQGMSGSGFDVRDGMRERLD